MSKKVIDFLENHQSATPSKFEENAKQRKENRTWLRWSRNVALALIDYMQVNGLNRNGLAERLEVSPQYVSKLLSGKVNFSFKSLADIEDKLGLRCLNVSLPDGNNIEY